MIEKQVTVDTMELQEDNSIILRERVAIIEDGEEISHSYKQRTIRPDDDVSKESKRIQHMLKAPKEE